jgi:hypothetical protein
VRRAIVICLGVCLLGGTAGCGTRFEVRTGRLTLEKAMSRAFKRSYAAAYRMTTGHARRGVIRHAAMRCRPLTRQPTDEGRSWHWFCRVRFYKRRSVRAQLATYGVRVSALGCFEARTGAFPSTLHERVLERTARDPLIYIRSCP